MVQRYPRVDALVARDTLGSLEREAAGEDSQTPQHRLLIGREEGVTPFERSAQRLMAAQHDARAGGQQVESLIEPRAQALHAEQRQSRGGKLDRKRNPVEAPANLGYGRQVRCRQHEARIDGLRARFEELQRAVLRDRARVCRRRHSERPEAVHVLVGSTKGFLTRYQNGNARCAGGHGVDERRDGVGEMLAIVENEHRALRRELQSQNVRGWAVAGEPNPHRLRDGRRHERAVGKSRKLHPPDAVGIVGGALRRDALRYGLRDLGFPDAPGTRDRDDRMLAQQLRDRVEIRRATK